MPLRKLKIYIPVLFYALLIIFLILYLRSIDFNTLKDIRIDWTSVLVATLFGLVGRYWGAYIWFVLLHGLGAATIGNKTMLVYVYAKSWLGRYIPGTAPWILGKIYFASKQGISKHKLAVSSLLEGGLQVCVVLVLSAILLMFDSRLDVIGPGFKLAMVAAIVFGVIALIPQVFNKLVTVTYKIIRKNNIEKEHLANGRMILKGAALYSVGAIISGISFFYIAKAVYPGLPYENALFVIGTASLAGAASMLAVFVPSGLGVRESIQLVLLSVIMPKEYALVITVFTRIWSIVLDFIFFGLAYLLKTSSKKYNLN